MIAIVIPYFKSTFFKETLDSLANQTDKRFKVYVGDDESLNKPNALLEKYKNQFEFVYHRFDSNLGSVSLVKQWERCISMTGGEEWIMILGDDDYISNNYIEEFYNNLNEINKNNIKVVHFASQVIQINGEFSNVYKHPKIEKSTDFFFRKLFGRSRGSLTEQIFRKDAYLESGFRDFPLAWGTDDFAWLDFTKFGSIYSINTAIAFFRISNENISRPYYKENIKNEAKFFFISIIINKYLKKFNQIQRIRLLLYYEQLAYNYNKISFKFWIKMCFKFLIEKQYIQIIKFSRRLLIFKFK